LLSSIDLDKSHDSFPAESMGTDHSFSRLHHAFNRMAVLPVASRMRNALLFSSRIQMHPQSEVTQRDESAGCSRLLSCS
jgi:hypothetical protein